MAQSAYENEMSDLMAENYTQQYPIIPWWEEDEFKEAPNDIDITAGLNGSPDLA